MSILKKGDCIAFAAPSSLINEEDYMVLDKAKNYFCDLGLDVILADNLCLSYRYMAGSDDVRAKSINDLFLNEKVKAIFCIRGGAGATRILDKLDYELIKKNPKPIIGLSDSTALQNAVYTKTGGFGLTGFLPLYDFKKGYLVDDIKQALESVLFEDSHEISSGKTLIKGEAQGEMVGGCLSVFNYLAGTAYFPDLTGKILLLEDVGEKTYKIDLMLNQLLQQKNFDKLLGIVLGKFSNSITVNQVDGDVMSVIEDFALKVNIPVVYDFNYGHIENRFILPIGKKIKLLADDCGGTISW